MRKMSSEYAHGFRIGACAGWLAAVLICSLTVVFSEDAESAEFLGSDVQAWAGAETITDGSEAVQLGITLEWKYVEFDLSHGVRQVPWRVPAEPEWEMDEWQSGTTATIRAYPFNTQTFRPLLIWSHASDITRGSPFNDEEEPTSDFFGAGVTVEVEWLDIDVAYGSFGRECQIIHCAPGSRTEEFRVSFRGYFWK